MIFFNLFIVFFKIGLFSFGGGYAMIPLMQTELQTAGWLDAREFADIVSISQMTPGPVGINAATYVGLRTAGITGSICATLGVFLPSFLIIIILAHFIEKFKNSLIINNLFMGIRPATIGLIAVAVLFFAQMSILVSPVGIENIGRHLLGKPLERPFSFSVSLRGTLIFSIVLIGITRFKLATIPAIIISAVLGVILF